MPARAGAKGAKKQNAEGVPSNRFASRTAFEALSVDQMDSEEEDLVPEEAEPTPPAPVPARSKSRKSKATKKKETPALASSVKKEDTLLNTDNLKTSEPSSTTGSSSQPAVDGSSASPTTAPVAEAAKPNAVPLSVPKPDVDTAKPLSAPVPQPTPAAATPAQKPAVAKSPVTMKEQPSVVTTKTTDPKEESRAFWKKVYQRVIFSLLMIAGFSFTLAMGPSYLILMVLLLETMVYREISALFNIPGNTILGSRVSQSEAEEEDEDVTQREKEREELWSKTMSWYFFAVCNFFLYGESLVYYFKHIVMTDSIFLHFARHHRFISFMLYMFGFMAFVSNLKRRNLKHQFALFCWVHMSLMLIVLSSHFIVSNILEGIIWFWVPASLVICNDVFAYVCGMLFGRTPLISLSPKKTMEGFVGALLITLVFSWFWAGFFQQFSYLTCPAVDLGMNVFNPPDCAANPVFATHYAPLPSQVAEVLTTLLGRPITQISWTPFQFHAVVMAAFASLVAPFGGFFASGFKRAFKIKDFGDSIPGHGGLTDRFDCQFVMGLFSYVYYTSLIRDTRFTVEMALQMVTTHLSVEDQKRFVSELSALVAKL